MPLVLILSFDFDFAFAASDLFNFMDDSLFMARPAGDPNQFNMSISCGTTTTVKKMTKNYVNGSYNFSLQRIISTVHIC